ncbi:SMI1/KNR4 family protein [Microtetraspora niveoalba]|uniref:SMI1/KNR4 family protein n=1 Tax=Microtetraspora niveoalba TaxID=46175 RepID=UPI000837A3ED|nr:SMI1/KNR4 family protein [Microtetraspora niveoalba]
MSGTAVKVLAMAVSKAPRYPWNDLLHSVNAAAQEYFAQYRAHLAQRPAQPDDGFGRAPWLGTTGASEAEIVRHEERLGMRLPPSYREFLQVTDGWDEYSHSSLRLLSLNEVGWTRDVEPMIAQIWDGLDGADPQDTWYLHQESVSASLCVSEEIEGQVWLLNPHVVGPDGEWEAWDFASWHPGEVRYRSFWDLMEYQFGRYLA